MKDIQTKPVDKYKHAGFLRKADSFYRAMKTAESNDDWNAASLNAIHCAISSSDAVTAYVLGERSAGQKHEDAAALLQKTGLPEAHDKARQFLDIVQLKTLIEYEPEEPSENQARQITKQTERFYNWAKQVPLQ